MRKHVTFSFSLAADIPQILQASMLFLELEHQDWLETERGDPLFYLQAPIAGVKERIHAVAINKRPTMRIFSTEKTTYISL